MKYASAINKALTAAGMGAGGAGVGITGAALQAGAGLDMDSLMGLALVVFGIFSSLLAGRVPPDPAPVSPGGARERVERAGLIGGVMLALAALAFSCSGCSGPPSPPAHVGTAATVQVTDSGAVEVDATTQWRLCLAEGRGACIFVDVAFLWADDARAVCVELPQWPGTLVCHPITGGAGGAADEGGAVDEDQGGEPGEGDASLGRQQHQHAFGGCCVVAS